jgi:hypothetical protein
VTPHPLATRCPRCRAEVLEGRDDLDPSRVLLDPTPLDPMGELGAVLVDVRTYEIVARDGRVACRTPFSMRHRPAGTRGTVHARHRCEGGSPA